MHKTLVIALCLAILAPAAVAVDPVTEVGASTFAVQVDGHVLQTPYDSNQSLSGFSSQVLRAVVLVPGSSRSSSHANETLAQAATIAGVNDGTSLLVAPQFLIEVDIDFHQLPADRLFWSDSGWKQGNASLTTAQNPRPVRVSSFAVMDSILYRIASHHPNLQSIVVAGHSAGGQFVNRFAAGNTAEQVLQAEFGVDLRYVTANPSSYLYFNPERVVFGTLDQFATPPASVVQSCPAYDDYKYGLQARNNYMSQVSSAQIVNQYSARHVTYLLGELDVNPDPDLDTSCAAMLQGSHRFERGEVYGNYLRHFLGAASNEHRPVIVFGVGHDSRDMFTSSAGVAQLFGWENPVAVGPESASTSWPSQLRLGPNLPNPFQNRTTMAYRLPDAQHNSTLRVYDCAGRLVRTLHAGPSVAGSFVWDGRSSAGGRVAAGVYFCCLQHGREAVTRRVVVLR
jgi:opacity protein-like surface antigen